MIESPTHGSSIKRARQSAPSDSGEDPEATATPSYTAVAFIGTPNLTDSIFLDGQKMAIFQEKGQLGLTLRCKGQVLTGIMLEKKSIPLLFVVLSTPVQLWYVTLLGGFTEQQHRFLGLLSRCGPYDHLVAPGFFFTYCLPYTSLFFL